MINVATTLALTLLCAWTAQLIFVLVQYHGTPRPAGEERRSR